MVLSVYVLVLLFALVPVSILLVGVVTYLLA